MGHVNESEMIEQMWPGGKQPVTDKPYFIVNAAEDRGSKNYRTGGTFSAPMTVSFYCPTQGAVSYTHLDVYKRQVCVPDKYEHLVPDFSQGGHDARLVSFIDLPATWLNLSGAEVPEYFEGNPIMGPNSYPERGYAFGARDRADDMFEMSRAVTDGRYFYVRHYMPHLPYIQPGFIFSDEKEAFKAVSYTHLLGNTAGFADLTDGNPVVSVFPH